MKIIDKNNTSYRSPVNNLKRFNLALGSLVLTSILSLGVSWIPVESAVAHPTAASALENSNLVQHQSNPRNQTIAQARRRNTTNNRLPQRVLNAVRQDLSRRTGIARSSLRLTSSTRRTWSNGCLGLESPEKMCSQAQVEGWRVVMSNGRQSWAYRTDNTGRNIALETENASTSTNLPQSVRNAVLQNASAQSGLPTSRLAIESSQRRTWSDGCLGIHEPNTGCTLALVPGWQVTVTGGSQRWIYRTNESGSAVKLDRAASNISEASNSALPQSVRNAVLRNASEQSGLPNSRLRIELAQQRTWSDGCLGLGGIEQLCSQALVPGWQVVVTNGSQRWVYRTNGSGSVVRLDGAASSSTSQLSIDN